MTSSDPWLSAEQQHSWRTWLRTYADLNAVLSKDLQASTELSHSDFAVLVQLTDNPQGRVRITDLAGLLNWDRSRVSHHLKRMQARNLVNRSDCPDDGRVAFVFITDTGRDAIERAAPRHAELVRRLVFDDMSEEDLRHFTRITEGILARVRAS